MTTTTKPLPTTLDLWAIHRAFLDAGFTHHRSETAETDPNWVYRRPTGIEFIGLPNPHFGFEGDGLSCTPESQRQAAVAALDALSAFTGQPHLECGPRNDRERALIDVINAHLHVA